MVCEAADAMKYRLAKSPPKSARLIVVSAPAGRRHPVVIVTPLVVPQNTDPEFVEGMLTRTPYCGTTVAMAVMLVAYTAVAPMVAWNVVAVSGISSPRAV